MQNGDHWHVRGLTLTGSPWLGYYCRMCNSSVWESLHIHGNDNSGFHLENGGDNLLLNCDIHNNFDPQDNGQDADGIAFKFGSGTGNAIHGCRTWNNSDDGLDFWMFADPVEVRETWSFGNGLELWNVGADFEGNGNGFKLGGGRPEVPAVAHQLHNSLAWGNARCGFDHNGNLGQLCLTHNSAFDNGWSGYCFFDGEAFLRNNLDAGPNATQIGDSVDGPDNSWSLQLDVTAQDFISVDATLGLAPRSSDGSLPQNDFLHLAPNSDLIDADHHYTGCPFDGDAPDLGAFERQVE